MTMQVYGVAGRATRHGPCAARERSLSTHVSPLLCSEAIADPRNIVVTVLPAESDIQNQVLSHVVARRSRCMFMVWPMPAATTCLSR